LVSRQRLTRAALWLACGLTGAMGAAPLARAADAKVAIGHYHWSTPVVNIDLGQHVTWYWVGPDTMHSVTGISANDIGEDSDPNNPEPEHKLGFTYRLTFNQPGVYQFHCKLHAIVHGEVVVSDVPGNPADDPDPIPRLNVDLTRPTLNDFFLASRRFRPARGTALHFALDDPSLVDAEIWHVSPGGHRGKYAGWQQWRAHIGFNEVPFANRGRHFTPKPGRYLAYVNATDLFNNVSRIRTVHFTIAAPSRPRRHSAMPAR
jgi:plastocyanin